MKGITIEKKTNYKVEQLELLISILCLLNDIHLSKTDARVLAYFIVHKICDKTDTLLINSKVVKDVGALRNAKTRLLKLGFLKRTKELYKSYELNISSEFNFADSEIKLLIKLNNN